MNLSISGLIVLTAYLASAQSDTDIQTLLTTKTALKQDLPVQQPYLTDANSRIISESIPLCAREGLNRIAGECHSYVDCVKSETSYRVYKYRCPEGLVFGESEGVCDWPWNVPECMITDEETLLTRDEEFVFNSGINANTSALSDIINTLPVLELTTIIPLSDAKLFINQSTITEFINKDYRCPTTALERHPLNCSQYYSCEKSDIKNVFVLNVFNCPNPLLFNSSNQLCVQPYLVTDCKNADSDLAEDRIRPPKRPVNPPYSPSGQNQRPPYQPPKSHSQSKPTPTARPSNSGTKGGSGGTATSKRKTNWSLIINSTVKGRPTPRPITPRPPVKGVKQKPITTNKAYGNRPNRPHTTKAPTPTVPKPTPPRPTTPHDSDDEQQHEEEDHNFDPIVLPSQDPISGDHYPEYEPQDPFWHNPNQPNSQNSPQTERPTGGRPPYVHRPQYHPTQRPQTNPQTPYRPGSHSPNQPSQEPFYPVPHPTNPHYPPRPTLPSEPHYPHRPEPQPQYPHRPNPQNPNPRPPYPHPQRPQPQEESHPEPHYPYPEPHPQPHPEPPHLPGLFPNKKCRLEGDFLNHRYDCTKFYRCSNGYIYSFDCPSGLYFDNSLNVCNWPAQVAQPCGRPRSANPHSAHTPAQMHKTRDKSFTNIEKNIQFYDFEPYVQTQTTTQFDSQPQYWLTNEHIIYTYPIDQTQTLIETPEHILYPTVYLDENDNQLVILSQNQLFKK